MNEPVATDRQGSLWHARNTHVPRLTQASAAPADIQQQLAKILASQHFARAARVRRFLHFIVEQTLAGRENNLKEYSLGLEVFDKGAAYDPRLDPIVRVTARELRSKLAAYYRTDGLDDRIVIQCPSGSYIATFSDRRAREKSDDGDVRALYLKGLFLFNWQGRRGFAKSLQCFRRALRKDPANAAAEAALAHSYIAQCFFGVAAPRQIMPRVRACALRALAIDDQIADAYCSLATVKAAYEWDWPAAEKEYKRALELNPDSAAINRWYAVAYLAPLGLLEDAIGALQRAVTLEPHSVINSVSLAQTLYLARRFEAAVRQARQTLDLNPDSGPAHLMLGLAHMQRSRHDEAVDAFRMVETLASDETFLKGALGHCLASVGRLREARRVLDELMAISRRRYVPPLDIASVHIGLNDHDRAFAWLKKGFEQRCARLIWLNVHPMFDPLRRDRRFLILKKRIGLAA